MVRITQMEYRVYFFSNEDRVDSFLVIVCESDAGAIEQAKQFVNGQDVELWQQSRLVIRLFSRDQWQSPLKRFSPDLNRRDSQRVKDRRICVH